MDKRLWLTASTLLRLLKCLFWAEDEAPPRVKPLEMVSIRPLIGLSRSCSRGRLREQSLLRPSLPYVRSGLLHIVSFMRERLLWSESSFTNCQRYPARMSLSNSSLSVVHSSVVCPQFSCNRQTLVSSADRGVGHFLIVISSAFKASLSTFVIGVLRFA